MTANRFALLKNIPRKSLLNRRSLGFARDDKGEDGVPTETVASEVERQIPRLPRDDKGEGGVPTNSGC